ncbi:MAG: hypothetical protein PWP27_699 [Clostridiales bacterium]|jgi:Zn-dependent protease|nr:hypothetical protein [Clostridiales bacterium]MDK2932889.1 hypothetical protein [Clostridiales bacterium]
MFHINPMSILLSLPGIFIGFAFHEFAHAFAADRLGDSTPRSQGRLTLDPLPHIDIMGLILIIIAGFGWAKPVQVNPRNFKNPKRDDIIVSLAGPMINFAIALLFVVLLKLLVITGVFYFINTTITSGIEALIYQTVWINLILFVFNLLPIYPLDGYHVLSHFVPYSNREKLYRLRYFSRFILLIILITPVASYVILPVVSSLYDGLFTLLKL